MRINVNIAVTAASAYSAGQAVGTKFLLPGFTGQLDGWAIVDGVLLDKAGNAVPYDLALFDGEPSATTVTDRTAFVVKDADRAKSLGHLPLATSCSLGTPSGGDGGIAISTTGIYKRLDLTAVPWGVLIARGAPTFGTTSDLSLKLIVEKVWA